MRAGRAQAPHAVHEVDAPQSSGIADWYGDADLLDAFAVALAPIDAAKGIDHLARCIMGDPPLWLRTLLGLRDGIVAGFGIKTSFELRRQSEAAGLAHIDFFRLVSKSDCEVILGEDDRHLDFRASVMLREHAGGGAEIVATTVVRCHNALGHAYLAMIHPFHRFIVQANLERAAHKGWTAADSRLG